jgi:predicted flap endonuclease-1-like 5' DNA nuclease
MTRNLTMFLSAMTLLLVTPSDASASHYLLEDLVYVTATERAALEGQGVLASEDLLVRAATLKNRGALCRKTGITAARMEALTNMVDLLQIRGVGPSMVRLLQASGVAHAGMLAKQHPSSLHEAVLEANAREQISPKTPAVEMLSDWIRQAGSVPVRVRRR